MWLMVRSFRFVALLTVAAAASGLWAQGKWPLREIRIEGNQLYSDAQLVAATGLKVGQMADRAVFETGQANLLATGVLETVAFEFGPARGGQGYAVTYKVAEIQQVYPVQFENIGATDEELTAWLKQHDPLFTGKAPGTEGMLKRYSRLIGEYLAKKGKKEPVTGEVTATMPGEYYIMFHPKGVMPVVAGVDFRGNTVIPTRSLREAINGIAIGSRYSPGNFQLMLNAGVRQAYEARGRVDVKFPKIETEPAGGDVNGVRVIVTIDEGESYSFGKISVGGTASMNKPLYDAAKIKPGDVANLPEVSFASERIAESMKSAGYLSAKVTGETERRPGEEARECCFHGQPGAAVQVRQAPPGGSGPARRVRGGTIVGAKDRRSVRPAYAEFFLRRITEDGLFDNLKKTAHRVELHEDSATADIVLIFNPEDPKMRFGTAPEPEPKWDPTP